MSKDTSSNNEYLPFIEEAKKKQIKLNNKQMKQIRDLYADVAKNLQVKANNARKGSLTDRWVNDYKKAVEQEMKRIDKILFSQISDSILESASIPIGIQLNFFGLIDNKHKANIDQSFTSMFSNVPNKVLHEIINGDIYKDGRGLSKRLWWNEKKVNGNIDYIIQKGIAEKKDAFELAKDLQTYLNPEAKKDFEFKSRYGNKRVEYNSFRLAITSISHAYQLSMQRSCKKNPFVTGIQWHISNSTHRKVCALCISRNGKIYPVDELPLDHPMGMCHFTLVIPDSMEDIGTRLNKWGNGGNDPTLDEWYNKYGDYFSGESDLLRNINKNNTKYNQNNGIISNKKWLESNFSSEKKFNKHIEKHLDEYGDITKDEYLGIARELLAAPLSEDLEGFSGEAGFIFKYRKSTNDFAIGSPDGNISTLFKPKDGYKYWIDQMEEYKKEE